MTRIILASLSPRRKELLEQLGLKFDIVPSHAEENFSNWVDPAQLARDLSLRKAEKVAAENHGVLIIAADTLVVSGGQIMGKPRDAEDARRMLAALSGKAHQVITGFTIIDTERGKILSRSEETTVYLKKLSAEEIDRYVRSGEPLDKAGAYAIQGSGAVLITKIEGDYYNVVGLPLQSLSEALREFGISVL